MSVLAAQTGAREWSVSAIIPLPTFNSADCPQAAMVPMPHSFWNSSRTSRLEIKHGISREIRKEEKEEKAALEKEAGRRRRRRKEGMFI